MNTYNTSDVIASVLLKGHVPTGNSTFTPDQLLSLGDDELETALLRQILSVRESYYKTFIDYEVNATGIYAIPPDAIAIAISLVQIVTGTSIVPVNRIEISEQLSTQAPTATSYGFYLQNNDIVVMPAPTAGGVVRVWYIRRPSKMVQTTDCAQITEISGTDITVSAVPSSWTINNLVDLQQDQPNFNLLKSDGVITAINSDVISLDSAPSTLSIGDWICLADQTCVPQLPVEFRPLLVQRIVVKIYEIQGYSEKMKNAQKKLDDMEKDLFGLISPRIENATKIIYPVNGGFLAGNGSRWSWPASGK